MDFANRLRITIITVSNVALWPTKLVSSSFGSDLSLLRGACLKVARKEAL